MCIVFLLPSLSTYCIVSGHMALSSDQRSLVVSNLVNGVDTYTVPPRQPIRSFSHVIRENKPLHVSSALQGALTIAGSDDGCIRLFEQRTGLLYAHLPHGHGESPVNMHNSWLSSRHSWYLCSDRHGMDNHVDLGSCLIFLTVLFRREALPHHQRVVG
jgi:hypothetical protein